MKLPEKLPMRAVIFMDGEKGYAVQQHANAEFGIAVVSERQDRNSIFKATWSIASMPDKTFASYKDLCDAINE